MDLGCQPLANALCGPAFNPQHEFAAPLAITVCRSCGLSQLTVVVDPQVLYTGYRFRSGASQQWVEHCEALAVEAAAIFKKPGLVIDIACNDGTQLKPFADRGWHVIGVDPSPAPFGFNARVETSFWDAKIAARLRDEHKPADLVIAQNVLGHVDDPVEFLRACESVLAPEGMLVVEVPTITKLLESVAFDTIYHEHLSYWSTSAMIRAARAAHLHLVRIQKFPDIHGGSNRYWFRRGGFIPRVASPLYEGTEYMRPYWFFATDVERKLERTQKQLEQFAADGKRIFGYGASAKSTVFLNALKNRGNTVWPEVILDDVPEKWGLLSPGLHIPIRDSSCLKNETDRPDVLWILSWNWTDQLEDKASKMGYGREYFITTPKVEVFE